MNGSLTSNPIRMKITDQTTHPAAKKQAEPTGDEYKRFEDLTKKLATTPKPQDQPS